MGEYVYKVTGKVVTDNQGRKANVLKYAYKPWAGWNTETEKANNRLYRETGCYNADRYVRTGKTFTGRVTMDEDGGGRSIEWFHGTISDYSFDSRAHREEIEAA